MATTIAAIVIMSSALCVTADNMPLPFTRNLSFNDSGHDVLIMQTLLARSSIASQINVPQNSLFDMQTQKALILYQQSIQTVETVGGVITPGILDENTANTLLDCCQCDHYVDAGLPAIQYGSQFKYKFLFTVSNNRSVETQGVLLDQNNKQMLTFHARLHGIDVNHTIWPAYSNTVGLNPLSSNGNTPTGLALIDLNSPETGPDAQEYYGQYPINRIVAGLSGNMALLLPSIRTGLLLHTGEWPNWQPTDPMPNSDGCIHIHPTEVKTIADILINQLGVEMRVNSNGTLPYPYSPQGLISIQQFDGCGRN